jgi:hypothetical protein
MPMPHDSIVVETSLKRPAQKADAERRRGLLLLRS